MYWDTQRNRLLVFCGMDANFSHQLLIDTPINKSWRRQEMRSKRKIYRQLSRSIGRKKRKLPETKRSSFQSISLRIQLSLDMIRQSRKSGRTMTIITRRCGAKSSPKWRRCTVAWSSPAGSAMTLRTCKGARWLSSRYHAKRHNCSCSTKRRTGN